MAGDRMMRYIVPFILMGHMKRFAGNCLRPQMNGNRDKWPADMFIDIFTRRLIMQKVKKEKQGGVWRQNRQSAKINLWLKLRENEARYASISDSGIYLFRTGIGLFWYEMDFKDTELPVDTLIEYEDQLQTFGLNKREHFIYRVAGKKSFIVSDHPNLKERKQRKRRGKTADTSIREEKAPITGQLN